MFTLSLLYTTFYLLIILSLLIFSFIHTPIYTVTHLSATNFIVFIQKYIPTKNLFFFLVFSMTGLPPVGLFFVKFNILAFLLYQTHLIVITFLFFLFFLNMLYYTQLFNFKNFKKTIYSVVNTEIFSTWNKYNFVKTQQSSYNTYRLTLMIVNILLFLVVSFLFFVDYFLIIAV